MILANRTSHCFGSSEPAGPLRREEHQGSGDISRDTEGSYDGCGGGGSSRGYDGAARFGEEGGGQEVGAGGGRGSQAGEAEGRTGGQQGSRSRHLSMPTGECAAVQS